MIFFQRMIAARDRECENCGEVIEEGQMYWRTKREEIWCSECVDYEREHPSGPAGG